MSMEDAPNKIPKTIWHHSLDPVERFRNEMAWIKEEYMTDHFFIATNYLMIFIDDFDEWLNGITKFGFKEDKITRFTIPKELNSKIVREIKQIYYAEPVPLHQKQIRNEFLEIIHHEIAFTVPDNYPDNVEFIKLPALLHLNPKSSVKDDTNPIVLIQEPMEVNLAYDGYSPKQLAEVFKFKTEEADGYVPFWDTDEDIMTSQDEIMEISREQYHKIIKKLVMEFHKRRKVLWNNFNQILEAYKNIIGERALMSANSMGASASVLEYK